MAATLLVIVENLLASDSRLIQQATEELNDKLKRPESYLDLCHVMIAGVQPPVRQYAALILKRKLSKSRTWEKLGHNVQSRLKEAVLSALAQEINDAVRNGIAQAVGTIARHDIPSGKWPTLFEFFHQLLQSEHAPQRQLGIYVISVVSGIAAAQLSTHLTQFLHLFPSQLSSEDPVVAFHTIQTLTNFAPIVGQDNREQYQKLLPFCVNIVKDFVTSDEEKAHQAMDLFDILADCDIALLVPQLKKILQLHIEIAQNRSLTNALRTKAITFLGYVVRLKKKYISKAKLSQPIVETLYMVLCEEGEEEDVVLGFLRSDELADGSPIHAAAQALDSCSMHLPSAKLLQHLLSMVDVSLKSVNQLQIKGAYLALAMCTEGCADTLRTKHLHQLLHCISEGVASKDQTTRNSALFALGQFAEHLQPDISKYHADIVPVLLEYLKQVCIAAGNGAEDLPGVDRIFYALEVFCEHLAAQLEPYLPTLMECLFAALTTSSSIHLKELAISAIGASATAAKELMVPYFERLVGLLQQYLLVEETSDIQSLQIQSLDTLAVLARGMGADNFKRYIEDCSNLGFQLLEQNDDPDVRRSCYLLFSSLASVDKDFIAQHLPKLMDYMINSLRSTEGVVVHLKSDFLGSTVIEGLSDSDSDTDREIDLGDDTNDRADRARDFDDPDADDFDVEDSFLTEKGGTCNALKGLAFHCGDHFVAHLDHVAEEVYQLLDHHHAALRNSAVDAMTQFGMTLAQSTLSSSKQDLQKWMVIIIPKFSLLIRTETDYNIVMCCLEAFAHLTKHAGHIIAQHEGHLDAIFNCVTDVLRGKTICQDMSNEGDSEDEGGAEQDEVLFEFAGEVLPALGKVMGPSLFALRLATIIPILEAKLTPNSSGSERSFCIGTLAECVEPLGTAMSQHLEKLFPIFLQFCHDPENDVRSNAIFGLGLLAEFGGKDVSPLYPRLLQTLSDLLAKETFPRALDNICGAVARLITANCGLVPIPQVFPVLLQCLPLRDDFEENKTVLKCFATLYDLQNPAIPQYLSAILHFCGDVYALDEVDEISAAIVCRLVRELRKTLPTEFQNSLSNLDAKLAKCLTAAMET